MRHDLGRLACLIRPNAHDRSAPARLRGHRKPHGKRPAGLARFFGFTTWCVSTSRIHSSVNHESNPAPSVFSRALWPLTSLGLLWWISGRSAQSLNNAWYLDKLLDLLGDRKMSLRSVLLLWRQSSGFSRSGTVSVPSRASPLRSSYWL